MSRKDRKYFNMTTKSNYKHMKKDMKKKKLDMVEDDPDCRGDPDKR